MTVHVVRARELALALPEAVEQDHHGRPSFRIGGKIFATLWDEHHLNVMLDEDGVRTAIHDRPDACSEVWWGKRLAAVRVDLRVIDESALAALLSDAWEGKAPKRLLRWDASGDPGETRPAVRVLTDAATHRRAHSAADPLCPYSS